MKKSRKIALIVCAALFASPLLSSVASAGSDTDWINTMSDVRNQIGATAAASHNAGKVGASMGAMNRNVKALGCYSWWGSKC